MNAHDFSLAGIPLKALCTGALWWPDQALLCVSDLHLGKSERIARRGGSALPPYETRDTLTRLAADLALTKARTVICLGDSFDDLGAARALPEEEKLWIARLQAGRRWIWVEGNHDPGPVDLGGSHLAELPLVPLTFRHIAHAQASGEISGHYHPKASLSLRGRTVTRPVFLYDSDRLIMPAYGTYTGGLDCQSAVFAPLMRPEACAVLTGKTAVAVPMPR
ncbi:ligase-associated DNA damage response endonuclease PdeM [Sulfitobacter sp. JBTF-M27]|uniref:Ligase-associated DNA damage response endonuclease PdeM n=1 Tax=Sulfitobacter sediminilitoris TaxID=2698830 RepID=A0A6P0CFP3_9RHOB|nr:ligase-associated DNA damage response endonuclease PdeM [Sulfitobacter sediminilitoris]NEK23274.1 ligase-associated DNA damage response endonuclease PdeM [Sulfitobacter sediminilitoris]